MNVITKEPNRIKALVLSDIHIFNDTDIAKIENSMEKLKDNKYDAIYLVGDILNSTNILYGNFTGRLLEFMAYLGHIAPTYIVYGAHDIGYYRLIRNNTWRDYQQKCQDAFLNKISGFHNINVLENETRDLTSDGKYTISGFNPSLMYGLYTPDGDEEKLLKEIEKYDFLNKLDPNKVNTLLCHYPNAIVSLKKEGVLANVDLSVSGHNHSGVTQFRYLPVEKLLNLFRQNNRGIITPGKSLKLNDTANLRGELKLGERNTLIINPSFKTFSHSAGILEKLDGMFYKGYTEIEYQDEIKLTRKNRAFIMRSIFNLT